MDKKLFVVDASGFLFRAYYAIRPMTGPSGESTHALFGFIRSLQKLEKDFSASHIVAVFDGPDNSHSRKILFSEYKAHRPKAPPDLYTQIEEAKRFCHLAEIPSLAVPKIEADDTIASIAILAKVQGFATFVVSADKDLAQLVDEKTTLLNPFKENRLLDPNGVKEEYGVFPEQIIDFFSLLGDSSDNIPGVDGIGEKGARDLIQKYGSLEALYEHLSELPEKRRAFLVNGQKSAFLSRALFTLQKDVAIDPAIFSYQKPSLLKEELKNFYYEKGFHSLVKGLEEVHKAPLHVTIVDSETSLLKLEKDLQGISELVFDTETTSENPYIANLVGISFSWKSQEGVYIPFNGTFEKEPILAFLRRLFSNKNLSFIAHNGKYDLHVLANADLPIPQISFDTIVASYLLNAHERRHNLDFLALEHLHLTKIPIDSLLGKGKNAITMDLVPIEKVANYSVEDAEATYRLQELFQKSLQTRGLTPLFNDVEMALLPVLFRMEERGIYIDLPLLSKLQKKLSYDLEHLQAEIYTLTGESFNLNSPKQLGHVLFEKLRIPPPKKTTTGFSTDADTLEKLRIYHPAIDKILTFRSLEKLRSTYLEKLPLEVNPKTGRVHPTFNQTQAATGRLSCQDPNLQNIPIRSEVGRQIREAFRPKETNFSYLSLDYSQIELRLLAHMSQDEKMIQAFLDEKDIHASTAAEIFNVAESEVTKEMRRQAKAVNFGVLYGQGEFGLSQEVGISRKDAAQFIERYFLRFPRVRLFLEECKEKARKEGRAITMTGRERLIPEISSKNQQVRQQAERLAVNTPLQGSAADLIKMAMIEVDQFLFTHSFPAYLLLQIHDELLLEVEESRIEECKEAIQQIMEKQWQLCVPLIVDTHIGKNWMEC